jgi:sortase B
MLDINSEGVGYMYIPSIDLRLPIAQGTDNDYYLTHTFNKTPNKAGSLFVDSRIIGGLSASHVIIYGHNMKNGSMFAKLASYLDASFFNTTGNDVFYIYTENKLLEYKIFSCYTADAISDTYLFDFTPAELLKYAADVKQYSDYDTGVDISSIKQVVTLSTCTSDGAKRIVVQGTFIGESTLN